MWQLISISMLSLHLQVIEVMLTAIMRSYPSEKVIVVSNFTVCLDAVEVRLAPILAPILDTIYS
jgi:hypothetical protein